MARRIMLLVLAIAATLTSAACVPEFDEARSFIDEASVLAVRSEPAEAAEGETVTLNALVAGRGRDESDVTFAFCTARKPLSELGPIAPACLEDGSRVREGLGPGPGVEALISEDACSLFGPRRPDPESGQPSGRPVDPDPTGGFYQPVMATLPDQEDVLGAIRLDCGLIGADQEEVIEYNQRHRPNRNPEISGVQLRRQSWDDVPIEDPSAAPLAVRRGRSFPVRASWVDCAAAKTCGDGQCNHDETLEACPEDCTDVAGCTGAEGYVFFDAETRELVSRREEIVASWYATAGTFDGYRTGPDEGASLATNTWTAPGTAGTVTFWVVLRDGRGGVGWRSFSIDVE